MFLKRENIAVIVACLAMIGTVGNLVFSIWNFRKMQDVKLSVFIKPLISEPCRAIPFMDLGKVIRPLCLCKITNESMKEAYISGVWGFGSGAIGEWAQAWGHSGGDYTLEASHDWVFTYDPSSKPSLKKMQLPLKISPNYQVSLITYIDMPLGKDIIKQLSKECQSQLSKELNPKQFIEHCLGMDFHLDIYSSPETSTPPINMEVRHTLNPVSEITTTESKRFNKECSLYIGKINPPDRYLQSK